MTFKAGDGTEYELRDTQLNGMQGVTYYSYCSVGLTPNRGRTFVSSDGTGVTFFSDTEIVDSDGSPVTQIFPSGFLLMPDGSRYRIDDGYVSWLRDRNGNKLKFEYGYGGLGKVTDALGRAINIAYGDDPATPYNDHDEITWIGYGDAQRPIKIWFNQLSQVLRAGFTIKTYQQLFPEMNGSSSTLFDLRVIGSVELPDGRRYWLKYNDYGELARVELPTGGAIEYDYMAGVVNAAVSGSYGGGGQFIDKQVYRRVTARRVYADKTSTVYEYLTTISRPDSLGGGNVGYVDVANLNYSGTWLSQERHYYYGSGLVPPGQLPTDYSAWKPGKEWKTEMWGGSTSPVTHSTENTWQQPSYTTTWPLTQAETSDFARANNPKITTTLKRLNDANQVAQQAFSYDRNFNQTDVYEYDYGSGAPPAYATRHTHTDFVTSYTVGGIVKDYDLDLTIHLKNLPKRQVVTAVNTSNGAETWAAQTEYEYDKYDTSTNHADLINRTNLSGPLGTSSPYDLCGGYAACPATFKTRGNVTQVDHWLNNGGNLKVSNYAQFDSAGNVVKAIDGRNNAIQFDFADRFGAPDGNAQTNTAPTQLGGLTTFAFATKVTDPLLYTGYTQFDYFLGQPVDGEDRNGIKASAYYNDFLDRPTQGIRAVGTTVATQTLFSYNDTTGTVNGKPPLSVTTISDKDTFGESNSGNGLKACARYDGLGRTWRGGRWNGSQWEVTDTQFDALGRTYRVSNPYAAADLVGAVNPAGVWTTTTYDALSRVLAVATPDNATVGTAYNGNQVVATDQAQKQRMSETDGLGRLKKVWEITAADSATVGVTFPNQTFNAGYLTSYAYDALDNLTTVTQQVGTSGTTQTRTFVYDPIKRLTSATNPESGTTGYTYDNNGNLLTKTDARSITTTLVYDALNRPASKTYSDGTPAVSYLYDAQVFPTGAPAGFNRGFATGRLVAMSYSGGSQGDYFGYDELGRAVRKTQQTGTVNYPVTATYNRASAMLSETYPSGRTVNYAYDTAGRASSAMGTLGDGVSRNYATGISYTAAGQLTKERFGTTTPLYHRRHYNNRLQLFDMRVGSDSNTINDGNSSGSWTMGSQDRGSTQLYYNTNYTIGDGGTNNNGNVWRMDTFVPLSATPATAWAAAIDYYSYDALNRITQIVEQSYGSATQTPAVPMLQAYLYDRFGNRTLDASQTFGGASNSTPYNYAVRQAPGRVEAEDFDWGGQGVGYSDADTSNNGGQYRPSEGVDIETNDGGTTSVGRTTVNG